MRTPPPPQAMREVTVSQWRALIGAHTAGSANPRVSVNTQLRRNAQNGSLLMIMCISYICLTFEVLRVNEVFHNLAPGFGRKAGRKVRRNGDLFVLLFSSYILVYSTSGQCEGGEINAVCEARAAATREGSRKISCPPCRGRMASILQLRLGVSPGGLLCRCNTNTTHVIRGCGA